MAPVIPISLTLRSKSSLTPLELARLEAFSLGLRGCMVNALRRARSDDSVLTATCAGAIAGWAIPSARTDKQPVVNFYVRPAFRRQGIGRALLARAREVFPVQAVRAHDTVSRAFFASAVDQATA